MGKMTMNHLREMLCEELDEITRKGELTAGGLETVDKLTHSIKSIDTIIAMDESGYSENGYSYARGRGRNARRDSMGRYSRAGDMYSERGERDGRRGGGYSYDEAKEDIIEQLHEMLDSTSNESIKRTIHKLINQLDD